MNLEELGINVEAIQEQVVQAATQQVFEEIIAACKKDIVEEVKKQVNNQISLVVTETVTNTLDNLYQPTSMWGEPEGKPTTLRDAFYNATKEWWDQKLDDRGNPTTSSYSGTKRYYYVAHQVVSDLLAGTLKKDLEKIINDSKEQLKKAIAENIAEAVKKL
jgi:hypothetical protein